MEGGLPSCRWCIALFTGHELGKTEPGAGSQGCGKLIEGIVGAFRALGGTNSSGGVASTRGKKRYSPGVDLGQR